MLLTTKRMQLSAKTSKIAAGRLISFTAALEWTSWLECLQTRPKLVKLNRNLPQDNLTNSVASSLAVF